MYPDIEFDKMVWRAQRWSKNEIKYMNSDAQALYRLIRKFYNENPNATENEIKDFFLKLFDELNLEIISIPLMKNMLIEYSVCSKLVMDKAYFNEIFNKSFQYSFSDEKEKEELISSSNIDNIAISTMLELRKEVEEDNNSVPESFRKQYSKLSKKEIREYKRKCDSSRRKIFSDAIYVINTPEEERARDILNRSIPIVNERIKSEYIRSLEIIGKRLNEFGFTDKIVTLQENLFKRLGLEGISYKYEDSDNSIGVSQLFNKDFLSKLDVEMLVFLNTFWLNKYVKELSGMNKAFFWINDMNYFERVRNANEKSNGMLYIYLTDEEKETVSSKMGILHQASKMILTKFKNDDDYDILETEEENGDVTQFKRADTNKYIAEIDKDIGEEYEKYFDERSPQTNNFFIEDIVNYSVLENAIHNLYVLKDDNLAGSLFFLFLQNVSDNWGIILDDFDEDSSRVVIAVDVKGLNFPCKVHVDKEDIKGFMTANKMKYIPLYQGNEDFWIEDDLLPIHVFMPLQKRQKDEINKLFNEENSKNKNLVEHLQYLSTGKFPEHLSNVSIRNRKGKTSGKKNVKQYYNIETEEIVDESNLIMEDEVR